MRIANLRFKSFQRPPDQSAQPALRQAFGERIHRRDAVDVDETLLAALDDFGFGMIHRARLGLDELAEDEHLVADLEILFHERQVPPAAMQPRRAVVEDEFKNGFAAAAKTFQSLRDNRAARRERFVLRQFGDFAEMPAVFVTARRVQEQIFNRENAEPGKLRRAFAANAPK